MSHVTDAITDSDGKGFVDKLQRCGSFEIITMSQFSALEIARTSDLERGKVFLCQGVDMTSGECEKAFADLRAMNCALMS